ncbi:MAG: FAD-binding oxidoreductase [Legionellales bacterium]|nr:FAD-binding oxidoreductase [Legionellales bacterium]
MSKTSYLKALKALFPANAVLTDPSQCWAYAYDNSRRHVLPDAVVFPTTTKEVQSLVCFCWENSLPLIPRGSGTGTPGGSVPVPKGIVLSTERMQSIVAFSPEDRTVTVQPGVINAHLQAHVGQKGFFWPPDPSSANTCTIGGNLAYNSAGPRAIKYGTPRENTLGLTAITGKGELIQTGCHTTKGVVGYDLTRLLIGSEGTLAVITEAILKLHPKPEAVATLQLWFESIESATDAIAAVMSQPIVPCALEWMDTHSVKLVRENTDLPVPDQAKALVMLEVDGPKEHLPYLVDQVLTVIKTGCLQVEQAHNAQDKERLWNARKALSPLLRQIAPKKINEDVVVPVSKIPQLINHLESLASKTNIAIVNFGHAGNGNIHVNLLVDPLDAAQMRHANEVLSEVFDIVLSLNGTISGEHGIGLEKKPYVTRELSPQVITLMAEIKKGFDPKGILNPNKIFDLP